MHNSEKKKSIRGTWWCRTGIWLTLVSIALLLVSLFGDRIEWLTPFSSFRLFLVASLILVISTLATTIGIAVSMGTAGDESAARSWGALTVGIILIGLILNQKPEMSGIPPIHDITTDTMNPPAFEAILPLRANAPNPPGYAGFKTAAQQLEAYPELTTLTIEKPVDEVFAAAERVARALGWEIVAADPDTGRIEATDTTPWFRFKDDVVIRLTTANTATRVDIRSKSRVGRSDLGTNARRIDTFLDRLREQTSSSSPGSNPVP